MARPLLYGGIASLLCGCALYLAATRDGSASPALHELSESAAAPTSAVAGAPDLEKFVDVPGNCALGTFISAMPCTKDVRGGACCGGLRPAFNNNCACKQMPGIVLSHGGSGISFLQNYLQCEYTDEANTPTVDLVAKTHLCFDQKEWCADRIGDIDVRMTAWYLGLAQIHDGATKDWAYVHAPEGAREDTALAVCKALGFTALKFAKEDEKGLSAATKSVSCSAAAANAGSIKDCAVTDIDATACDGGPCPVLRLECTYTKEGPGSQYCTRTGQRGIGRRGNRLQCTKGGAGTPTNGHERNLGTPHAVCGTAGVNESRIAWYDGYQDDYWSFRGQRNKEGVYTEFDLMRDQVQGEDILTRAELEVGDRKKELEQFEHENGDSVTKELHSFLDRLVGDDAWAKRRR